MTRSVTKEHAPKEISLFRRSGIDHRIIPYNNLPIALRSEIDNVMALRRRRLAATEAGLAIGLLLSGPTASKRNVHTLKQLITELIVIPTVTATASYVAMSHRVGRATTLAANQTTLTQLHQFIRSDPTAPYMAIHKSGDLILARKPAAGWRRFFFKPNIPRKWVKVY